MKKIYLLSFLVVVFFANAQLSLTKSFNEPVIGDVNKRIGHDTTVAISRVTGIGQVWNFTTLASNQYTEASTYTTVAATPSPAVFPAATLAEDQGNNNSFTMWKSTGTTWEVQGIQFPGTAVNFSNTAVFASWPVAYGYNSTDDFSGSAPSGTSTAIYNGSVTVKASGTGTVVMPGGMSYTNCLQVTSTLTVFETTGAGTSTLSEQSYSYYHSSQKFPIISLNYTTRINSLGTVNNFKAFVNVMTTPAGVSSNSNPHEMSVFPNPAHLKLTVDLPSASPATIVLYNSLGKKVREQSATVIDLADLPRGVYLLTVKQNERNYTKRIIVD